MWKVLGKDAMYVEMAEVWKEQIIAKSKEYEGDEKFIELMDKTEVKYLFDGSLETHNFLLEVPKDFTPEDIQIMADMILSIAKDDLDVPFVTVNDQYQKCQVIISNEDEPELLGANRTDGYGSGKIFMPIFDSLSKPGRANDSLM